MYNVILFLAFSFLTFNLDAQTSIQTSDVYETKFHESGYKTFTAKILRIYRPNESETMPYFLDTNYNYLNNPVRLSIFAERLENFKSLHEYLGKRVRVSGYVKMINGVPTIKIKEAYQLKSMTARH